MEPKNFEIERKQQLGKRRDPGRKQELDTWLNVFDLQGLVTGKPKDARRDGSEPTGIYIKEQLVGDVYSKPMNNFTQEEFTEKVKELLLKHQIT
jgi:hypothetical protein